MQASLMNTVPMLASFLEGIACLASVHMPEEAFNFSCLEVARETTPEATLERAHREFTRPSFNHHRHLMPTLQAMPNGYEMLDTVLLRWFLKHTPKHSARGSSLLRWFLKHLPKYAARDSAMETATRWLTGFCIEGCQETFGYEAALYSYSVPWEIYMDLKQAVYEDERILIIGPERA